MKTPCHTCDYYSYFKIFNHYLIGCDMSTTVLRTEKPTLNDRTSYLYKQMNKENVCQLQNLKLLHCGVFI